MKNFDPNGAAAPDSGIFGFPFDEENSKLIIIPVPWEVTASYGSGSSNAPSAIFDESKYVELFDIDLKNFYESGIAMIDINSQLEKWNKSGKKEAQVIIKKGGASTRNKKITKKVTAVDTYCKKMNNYVFEKCSNYLKKNKLVGILGGDHSVSLGSVKAHLNKYPNMTVLQLDAHADLRRKFEGFHYSHGSIMYNILEGTKLKKLVQVGVRGFCEEEFERAKKSKKITTFFETKIIDERMQGKSWDSICSKIIKSLSSQIYLSFDVDVLEQQSCPHTGTPVPGGISFQEAIHLIKKIVNSGRKIIGFDLVEVSSNKDTNWDAVVGAHLLYKICGWTIKSSK